MAPEPQPFAQCDRCGDDLFDGEAPGRIRLESRGGLPVVVWFCHDSTRPSCFELSLRDALIGASSRARLTLIVEEPGVT